jgi:hypothetical protein
MELSKGGPNFRDATINHRNTYETQQFDTPARLGAQPLNGPDYEALRPLIIERLSVIQTEKDKFKLPTQCDHFWNFFSWIGTHHAHRALEEFIQTWQPKRCKPLESLKLKAFLHFVDTAPTWNDKKKVAALLWRHQNMFSTTTKSIDFSALSRHSRPEAYFGIKTETAQLIAQKPSPNI